jgi:hypothetical protein
MENLEGNVLNLFLPLGWVAVTLFFASMCFLSIFTRWGNVSGLYHHALALGAMFLLTEVSSCVKSKANQLANSGNEPMLSKSQLA